MKAWVLTGLLASGLAGAAGAADEAAVIRGLRADYNAAIAAHDANRMKAFLRPDYHLIRGSSGRLTSGPEQTAAELAQDFADPAFVSYVRTPDKVTVAWTGQRAGETGHWLGTFREPDGVLRLTGEYLAVWVHTDGRWRLRSESFVTLGCEGSRVCAEKG